jgi:hypothetical protein
MVAIYAVLVTLGFTVARPWTTRVIRPPALVTTISHTYLPLSNVPDCTSVRPTVTEPVVGSGSTVIENAVAVVEANVFLIDAVTV